MKLNEIQLDALTEIINIGTGRAANALSEITGSRIDLSMPSLHVCGSSDFGEVAKTLGLEISTAIKQGFGGEVSGQALLAFPKHNAYELACAVGEIESSDDELDEELYGVLEEIGNIVLNSILGSVANLLECNLSYTLPQICADKTFTKVIYDCSDSNLCPESVVLLADTTVTVASRDISGSLLLLFETDDIMVLLSALMDESAA